MTILHRFDAELLQAAKIPGPRSSRAEISNADARELRGECGLLKNLLQLFVVVGIQWSAQCVTLFLAPFLSENFAIVAAGLLIVEHGMPPILAGACLFAGIVFSDLFLYGLGFISRHNRWTRGLLIRRNVRRARHWLDAHFVPVVALCRIVPGVLYPAFVACGWFGIPLRRFALTTMASAAIYMPAMLFVVVTFGEAVIHRVGYWAWFALLTLIVGIGVAGYFRPRWGVVAKIVAPRNLMRYFGRRCSGLRRRLGRRR